MAVVALTILSCQKEINVDNQPENVDTVETFTAVVDDDLTKADYNISGTKAVFTWETGDTFFRFVRKHSGDTYSNYDQYTYYIDTIDPSDGASATFTGSSVGSDYEDTGFALFKMSYVKSSSTLQFVLDEQLAYNPSNPLKNIVPMVGTKSGSQYSFKPVVGVIGIKVSSIPSLVTAVSISSTSGGFSGTSVTMTSKTDATYKNSIEDLVGAGSVGLQKGWFTAGTTKTFTVSGLDASSTYTFYFPVPVGTYSDLKIDFKAGDTVLKSVTATGLNLAVARGKIITIPAVIDGTQIPTETWTSMGTGKFIDTFVWSENSFGTTPVEVEFFQSNIAGKYRIANPYAAKAGVTPASDDAYLEFSVGEKGRVTYGWTNMGLPLSKLPSKNWAMFDGYSLAGYANGYTRSHVVSYTATGDLANVQLAPCYRTEDEYKTGGPSTYDQEVGKDGYNGIIEIAFPGNDILMPYPISTISVSSSQSGDGGGAAALKDDDLTTFWHSPYSPASTTFDATYGEYVQVKLDEGLSKLAFNYCTRNHSNQTVAPGMVVVGGSKNGRDWTVITTFELATMTSSAANTWIGLPVVDVSAYAYVRMGIAKTSAGTDLRAITSGSQYTNLSEFKIFGITTGAAAPWEPALETGQVWVQASQITVNSDATYNGGTPYDGGGKGAMVDFETSTFWHSAYYDAYDYPSSTSFDATYGITIDIALTSPIQDFHLSYYTRHNNNNGVPREIKFAGSNDGSTWELITTVADDALMKVAAGARVDLPNVNASKSYNYLRIGITKAGNGDTPNNLTVASGGSTAIAELLLFKD